MLSVGVGLSLEKNPSLAAKEAVKTAKINLPPNAKINLAIVFASTKISCETLLKTISYTLEGVSIIGASGEAIISGEGVFSQGVVLMLLGFPKDIYFNAGYVRETKEKSERVSGEELGDKLLYRLQNLPRSLSLLISDRLKKERMSFIYGLQEKLGKSFPLIGISTTDNSKALKTHLYFNGNLLNNTYLGLLLGGKLNFGFGIKHGWKPLGKPHTITSATGNIVETIDHEPAAKFYQKYLDLDLPKLKERLKDISLLYPLGIRLAGEKEYLLRNAVGVEEDGSLRFQNHVPKDCTARLMIGTKETWLEASREAAEEAKKSPSSSITGLIKKDMRNFCLIFNSFSRYALLKKEINKEVEIIKEVLGAHTPLIGVYTHSAVAPLGAISYRGEVYFHNQTVTILNIAG